MNSPGKNYSFKLLASLLVLFCIHLIIHVPFLITDYFGEKDAAGLANDIVRASFSGEFRNLEYIIDSCPLYYYGILFLLKNGIITIPNLSNWLTMVSLISGAIVTAAMFAFVYRLTASFLAAWAASLILQLIPPFWFSNLYGFPTMVALAFFMTSLVVFQSALVQSVVRQKWILLAGAGILYILAVMTKVDLLLTSAIFCLPVWRSGHTLKEKIIWVGCLVVFSGFTFLLQQQFIEFMNSHQKVSWDYEEVGGYEDWGYKEFSSRYSLQLQEFFSRKNLLLTAKSVGIVTMPGVLLGGILVIRKKEWRSTIFWLICALLPLLLFWGMRPANSSRHILMPSLFLCVLLALPLVLHTWQRWTWAAFLCSLCFINYFSFPASAEYLWSPSGRLVASTYLFEEQAKDYHKLGKMIAHLPYEKIAVIADNGEMYAYFRSEVLRREQLSYVNYVHSKYTDIKRVESLEMKEDNHTKWFRYIRYKPEMSEINALVGDGFFLVIFNQELANELSRIPGMQGKWMRGSTKVS